MILWWYVKPNLELPSGEIQAQELSGKEAGEHKARLTQEEQNRELHTGGETSI